MMIKIHLTLLNILDANDFMKIYGKDSRYHHFIIDYVTNSTTKWIMHMFIGEIDTVIYKTMMESFRWWSCNNHKIINDKPDFNLMPHTYDPTNALLVDKFKAIPSLAFNHGKEVQADCCQYICEHQLYLLSHAHRSRSQCQDAHQKLHMA